MSKRSNAPGGPFTMFEQLENRRLLAVFHPEPVNTGGSVTLLSNGPESIQLQVQGTDEEDVIRVSTDGTTITTFVNGVTETFSDATVTEILIDGLGGSDFLFLDSNGGNPTTINGGSGNDDFGICTEDSRNLALIQSPLTINGGDGHDNLGMSDDQDNSGASYTFTDTDITCAEFATISYNTIEEASLSADKEANLIIVSNNSTLIQHVYGGEGEDVLYISDTLTPVNIYGGPGLDTYQIDHDNFGADAEAIVPQDDDIKVMTVGTGSTLTIADNVTLTGDRENMAGRVNFGYRATYIALTGALPMLITEALIATTNGYNNGAWNGTHHAFASAYSANSSASDGIGYARASDLGITSYNGIPVGGTDMIFTQTLYGDADLNHTVAFPDLLRVAQSYNLTGQFWFNGDFDYNQSVDFADVLRVAQNYGLSSATSSSRPGMTETILRQTENDSIVH